MNTMYIISQQRKHYSKDFRTGAAYIVLLNKYKPIDHALFQSFSLLIPKFADALLLYFSFSCASMLSLSTLICSFIWCIWNLNKLFGVRFAIVIFLNELSGLQETESLTSKMLVLTAKESNYPII